jgi:hypothetical protein
MQASSTDLLKMGLLFFWVGLMGQVFADFIDGLVAD